MITTASRIIALLSLAGAITSIVSPSNFPHFLIISSLVLAIPPIRRAWRGAEGTSLRPAIIWSGIAIGVTLLAQLAALDEPAETGRPFAGQVAYIAALSVFATLISVLNARTPGGGAWAILMALLVVVFLVPWLEGSGLAREGNGWDHLRLTPPWTIFYGLLVIAGVTNFLPTQFGQAAIALGLGFGLEYLMLTQVNWTHTTRGLLATGACLCWSAAVWLADMATLTAQVPPAGLERLWRWFRNRWGVVWALRVQERFNRSAQSAGWPIKLTWYGVVSTSPDPAEPLVIPDEAEAMLAGLLRRFATAEVLAQAGGSTPKEF